MRDQEVGAYEQVVWAIAAKLSRHCRHLRKDLVQEGLMKIWSLKDTEARTNRSAMLRQAAKFAMVDHLRRLHQERFVDFESAAKMGFVLETGDDGRPVGRRSRRSAKSRLTSSGFRAM